MQWAARIPATTNPDAMMMTNIKGVREPLLRGLEGGAEGCGEEGAGGGFAGDCGGHGGHGDGCGKEGRGGKLGEAVGEVGE